MKKVSPDMNLFENLSKEKKTYLIKIPGNCGKFRSVIIVCSVNTTIAVVGIRQCERWISEDVSIVINP